MKEIQLTQGFVALVDDDDYEFINQWKWYYQKNGYAVRIEYLGIINGKEKKKMIYMHNVIMGNAPDGMTVDHKNRIGIDNQKENFRFASRSQQNMNQGKKTNNTSGFIGICWHKEKEKWRAHIRINGKRKHLGYYDDKIEAAKVRDKVAKELFGEFAVLNFPEGR